jgi:hypothetical protein
MSRREELAKFLQDKKAAKASQQISTPAHKGSIRLSVALKKAVKTARNDPSTKHQCLRKVEILFKHAKETAAYWLAYAEIERGTKESNTCEKYMKALAHGERHLRAGTELRLIRAAISAANKESEEGSQTVASNASSPAFAAPAPRLAFTEPRPVLKPCLSALNVSLNSSCRSIGTPRKSVAFGSPDCMEFHELR